jgi:hypothetical protein
LIDKSLSEGNGRPLPPKLHPGAPAKHKLAAGEETEWRKWTPKLGDAVLVELADGQCWPGKVSQFLYRDISGTQVHADHQIIDRKQCFAGRTAARGNHFYPVRIFDTQQEPCVQNHMHTRCPELTDSVISIKSRMIPFDLRPDPPLLASTSLLTAYNHARYPESFDKAAEVREKEAATARIEAKQDTSEDAKAQRAAWNDHVLWAMNERRVEKMRIVNEQRERQILVNASNPTSTDKETSSTSRKRNCPDRQAGIFAVATPVLNTPLHKPAFTSPQRPISPRRLERKRNGVYSGLGEYSPRGRGGTYTPPRILPSGDETAVSPSPVPSSRIFDFVSPLGPPRDAAKVDENMRLPRKATTRRTSLEAVKEEALEDEGEGDWQVVQRRSRRGESAPCQEVKGSEGIAVD